MIYNLYPTGNYSSTSSENQSLDKPLSVDTHKILVQASIALSDASAHHVLLGDFNFHHPSRCGAEVRPDQSS